MIAVVPGVHVFDVNRGYMISLADVPPYRKIIIETPVSYPARVHPPLLIRPAFKSGVPI